KSCNLNPRFWYVRLGDMLTPAEFHYAIAKEWRFFEWFSQKILPVHCLVKSQFFYTVEQNTKTMVQDKRGDSF
ncbi:hypothetical protein OCF62_29595, partial [Bacillus wiedmannii]|uniref:hypothetical protein n=1 Tax=Bacillus wiedmannii TaxID=1890302 RepID=UPI0021D2DD06